MQFFKFALAAASVASAAVIRRSVVSDLGNTVSSVYTNVEVELGTIGTLVKNTITVEVVPEVKATLTTVNSILAAAVTEVDILVLGVVAPLVDSELEALVPVLQTTKTLVEDVHATVNTLVGAVTADVLALIKAELGPVLTLVNKLVTPIEVAAIGVVANVDSAVAVTVNGLVTDVKADLSSLLGPIATVVGSIL